MADMVRSRRPLYVLMVVAGAAAAAVTTLTTEWRFAPAVAWTVMAGLFDAWIWIFLGPADAERTRAHASAEEPNHATVEAMLVVASLASLAAVAVVIVGSHRADDASRAWLGILALACVIASWLLVQTVFTLRYAAMYYAPDEEGAPTGGIDFSQDEPPRYTDFAYMSLSLGMTYQVSDTTFQNSTIRAVALRHSLIAYLFGVVIIASTINILLGLAQ